MPQTFSKSAKHLLRLYTRKPMANPVDMSGQYVIVTGASPNSLGYETARILASWGATVVATCLHDVARMEESLKDDLRKIGVNEDNITGHVLDLCNADSVNGFTTWYRKKHHGKLHVLINNAGIHKNIFNPRKKPPLTEDGFELHWRTNYLGAFHLTRVLLPLLQQSGLDSGDARVVNVSSHLHDRGKNDNLFNENPHYHSWDAYGLSKLALIHFACEIQRRFAKTYNLQSVAVHPGSVNTNLTQPEMPRGRMGAAMHRISSALSSLVLLSPNAGAQTIVMCASTKPLRGGQYYERCGMAEPTDDSKDEVAAKRLWDQSETWAGTLAQPGGDEHEHI